MSRLPVLHCREENANSSPSFILTLGALPCVHRGPGPVRDWRPVFGPQAAAPGPESPDAGRPPDGRYFWIPELKGTRPPRGGHPAVRASALGPYPVLSHLLPLCQASISSPWASSHSLPGRRVTHRPCVIWVGPLRPSHCPSHGNMRRYPASPDIGDRDRSRSGYWPLPVLLCVESHRLRGFQGDNALLSSTTGWSRTLDSGAPHLTAGSSPCMEPRKPDI
jgi:hypothetical protein